MKRLLKTGNYMIIKSQTWVPGTQETVFNGKVCVNSVT